MILEFLSDSIFRVIAEPGQRPGPESSTAVVNHGLSFQGFSVEKGDEAFLIKTGVLRSVRRPLPSISMIVMGD